jgi:hypothetical protein
MASHGAIAIAVTGISLLLATPAGAVKSGIWSGTTKQTYMGPETTSQMPIGLQIKQGVVIAIDFGADFKGNSPECAVTDGPDAERLEVNTGFKGFEIKHERFTGTVTVQGQTVAVKGQFKGKHLRGSLTDSYKVFSTHCSTGRVPFTAKPGGSLIYIEPEP